MRGDKGSETGDLGGGQLKHLRPWLGSQWPGLALGVLGCTGARQARPEELQEPS